MKLHRLSGSKVDLGRMCLTWAHPDTEVVLDTAASVLEVKLGNAGHRMADVLAKAPLAHLPGEVAAWALGTEPFEGEEEVPAILERWESALAVSIAALQVTESEVSFAYNPVSGTARRIFPAKARDYEGAGVTAEEIPMTLDLIYRDGGALVVRDWKFGDGPLHTWIGKVGQVELAMLCMMTTYEDLDIVGEYAHVRTDGTIEVRQVKTFFPQHVRQWALEAVGALAAPFPPEPRANPMCGQCPRLTLCEEPAKVAEGLVPASALLPEGRAPFKLSEHIEGPEHAIWMHHVVKAVVDKAESIKRRLKAYADANPEVLVEKKAVTKEKPNLNNPRTAVEMAAFGAAGAIKATATWDAIEKEIGRKRSEELRKKLRDAGLLSASVSHTYDWKKP